MLGVIVPAKPNGLEPDDYRCTNVGPSGICGNILEAGGRESLPKAGKRRSKFCPRCRLLNLSS